MYFHIWHQWLIYLFSDISLLTFFAHGQLDIHISWPQLFHSEQTRWGLDISLLTQGHYSDGPHMSDRLRQLLCVFDGHLYRARHSGRDQSLCLVMMTVNSTTTCEVCAKFAEIYNINRADPQECRTRVCDHGRTLTRETVGKLSTFILNSTRSVHHEVLDLTAVLPHNRSIGWSDRDIEIACHFK